MSKVYHIIPWNTEKCIGKSYNESMAIAKDDEWVCFLDGDAVHTTTYFGKCIEEVIDSNPQYSLLTCTTNRIGCSYQRNHKIDWSNNDQEAHRALGESMWGTFKTQVTDITHHPPLSGVLIAIKKSAWSEVGGFVESKMLGVDNDIHIKFTKNNFKVGLMLGIYVQHWYRGGVTSNTLHLI